MVRRGERGGIQIPLLLAVIVIAFGGLGLWGFLRKWRFLTETQLRLNQCVGKTALGFRDTLNSLKTTNLEIQALRKAIEASKMTPIAIPPLEAALAAVVVSQEGILLLWEMKRSQWLMAKGCGKRGDFALPLPKLDLTRDPPDMTGLKLFIGLAKRRRRFEFRLGTPPGLQLPR